MPARQSSIRAESQQTLDDANLDGASIENTTSTPPEDEDDADDEEETVDTDAVAASA